MRLSLISVSEFVFNFFNQNRDAKGKGYLSCKLNQCDFPFQDEITKRKERGKPPLLFCCFLFSCLAHQQKKKEIHQIRGNGRRVI